MIKIGIQSQVTIRYGLHGAFFVEVLHVSNGIASVQEYLKQGSINDLVCNITINAPLILKVRDIFFLCGK